MNTMTDILNALFDSVSASLSIEEAGTVATTPLATAEDKIRIAFNADTNKLKIKMI